MSFDLKRLYDLLPALHRIRDTELGLRMLTEQERREIENSASSLDDQVYGPVKALLSIIADQIAVLEENLDQLYDDQFIETCSEWAVAYIGDLVGTRGLIVVPGSSFSQRAEVANTIGYRRRKGTASVIEQLARDVTNWNANVVEYFQRLATTQHLNHLRPDNLSVSGLRDWERLEYNGTPFGKMAHTVDVRRIEPKRGKYNIQNVGIFLWRLNSYSLTKVPACKVGDRRYTFDPLGRDIPLYTFPLTEKKITHLAEPINVPLPISRRLLYHQLDTYYGKQEKSILVYRNNQEVLPSSVTSPLPELSEIISVCDLSDRYDSLGNPMGWTNMPKEKIAIDPLLGRLAFPAAELPPERVHVSFYYGFSAALGGGEYDRANTFSESQGPVLEVSQGGSTIQNALDQLAAIGGVIEIIDNESYKEDLIVRVGAGKIIELRSADKKRPLLILNQEILIEAEENGKVIINGLVICGGRVRSPLLTSSGDSNQLESLSIRHCTLVPGSDLPSGSKVTEPRITIESPDTTVHVEKSIVGALNVYDGARVRVTDSIVDATDETLPAYTGLSPGAPGGVLISENSTFIGTVHTRIMELASNTIFMADEEGGSANGKTPVTAQRLQQGCVRFSYLPPGSRLPRPYRCQPASPQMAARVRPRFVSLTYGDPGYGQLSPHCAPEITQGADDESEMGAFHQLYQPQRISNLRTRLDEYLRFGLEAGIFYAS